MAAQGSKLMARARALGLGFGGENFELWRTIME